MDIFVSSVVGGFQAYRLAAAQGIEHLRMAGGLPVSAILMERDATASPASPQVACLQAVADSDAYLVILGERYGFENPKTGLSATQEEYREAVRCQKPILAFVQTGTKEASQKKFVQEVSDYQKGVFYARFDDPNGLRVEVEHAVAALFNAPRQAGSTTAGQQIVNNSGAKAVIAQHVGTINIGRK